MPAIRPSDPRVPVLPQYYVYSADNNHVGPVSAELIARGIIAGKLPDDAFIAPIGSSAWTPLAQVPEVHAAVTNAKKASTPPPPPASAELRAAPPLAAAHALFNPPPSALPPIPPPPPLPSIAPAPQPLTSPASFAPTPPSVEPAALLPAQPIPTPLAPPLLEAAAAMTASVAPPSLEAKKDEKKEEKKAILDPSWKLLPVAIFGVFAFIAIAEAVIVTILRR